MTLCRRTVLAAPLGFLVACSTTRSFRTTPGADRRVRVPLTELDADGAVVVEAGDTELVLVRDGDSYVALDLTCTHQGCALSKRREQLVCPCHGSRFDLKGAVLRGPAAEPLRTYTAELDGDAVVVHL